MKLSEYNLELAIRLGAPLTTEALLFWSVNNHRLQKLLVTVVLERPEDFCDNLVNSIYTVIQEEDMFVSLRDFKGKTIEVSREDRVLIKSALTVYVNRVGEG